MAFGSKKWLLSLSICALPTLSLAGEVAASNRHLAESPISFSYILQILASFAVVIVFIFGFAWMMKRSGRFGMTAGKNMRVVSSLSMGMREKIVMINVDGKNIVVGVAPGQIRTLYITEGDAGGDQTEPGNENTGFGSLLGKFMK